MRETGQGSGPVLIAEALDRLHSAGWSLGVAAFGSTDGAGRIVWQVDGRNGENWYAPTGRPRRGRGRRFRRGKWGCSGARVGSDEAGDGACATLEAKGASPWPSTSTKSLR